MEQTPASDSPPCVLREWDSAFFGLRIAQVTDPPRTAAQVAAIDAWAHAHAIRGLYLHLDATEEAVARLAKAAGYDMVEERLTYLAPTKGASALADALPEPPRLATADDLPGMMALGRVSHRNTRFYTDTHFDPDRADTMYARWIERQYADPDVVTWTVGPTGEPHGYYTVHADGVSGIMGLRPESRRQGIGKAFLLTGLAWLERRGVALNNLRTQSTNVGARRMFDACGAQLTYTEHVFHKWFDSSHA